jgi:hypothetical protein
MNALFYGLGVAVFTLLTVDVASTVIDDVLTKRVNETTWMLVVLGLFCFGLAAFCLVDGMDKLGWLP